MLDRPEACVAAFPTLLLLLSAGWIGLLRTSRPAWRTVAASAGVGACLLTLLLLQARVPLATELSVWRPVSLFGQGLLLSLDHPAWGSAMAISGLLVAVVLSRVGNPDPDIGNLAWSLPLAAFGLMGALAGNMLTLTIAWSLMGACRLAWWISAGDRNSAQDGQLVRLAGQEMAAPLLLMLAAHVNQSAAGIADRFDPLRSDAGALLFLLAVVARTAPLGTGQSRMAASIWTKPGFSLVQLLPPAAGLATLGRLELSAMPGAAAAAGQWLGLLIFAAAAVVWTTLVERKLAAGWLAWGLCGLGLLLASLDLAQGVQALTALIVLLGGLQSISVVNQLWQRVWPALGFLAAVGVPGLPGAGVAAAMGERLLSGELRWVWIGVPAGMAIIAAGVLQDAVRSSASETTSVAGTRVLGTDLAALALAAVSILVSLRQGWVGSGPALALLAATSLAGLLVALGAARGRATLPAWPALALSGRVAKRIGSVISSAGSGVLGAVGSIAALFEGRAGLLWMFLVLLAAWLAVQA